jgi:hypothetical protein
MRHNEFKRIYILLIILASLEAIETIARFI